MERLYNFSAGPAVLPESVLMEVKKELPVYRANVGASIIEISHRSPAYTEVVDSARQLLRELLGLDESWHILFLQGGASTQFLQIPMNFLDTGKTAVYLNTGAWSKKAIKEAERYGSVTVGASSEAEGFTFIPKQDGWDLDENASYVHYTSNNTIFGTEFHFEPDTGSVPLVCDASSNFLSKPIDVDRYGLIYAGAQKNVGPAGVTIVLIRDSFLQTRNADIPTIMDYGTHTAKLFNTPPVFAVYMVEKVLRWLKDLGGLTAIQQQNQAKAKKLYDMLDSTDFYRGTAQPDSRSLMNVCFRLKDEALEPTFLSEAAENGLVSMKGHRSVGGVRASIYNAMPPDGVERLVTFMRAFEHKYG